MIKTNVFIYLPTAASTINENIYIESPAVASASGSPSMLYIYAPVAVSSWYEFQAYFLNSADAQDVLVNDVLTDSALNDYKIIGFYNPGDPLQNETNSLCQDEWNLKVEFITTDILPTEDTDYNSKIEPPPSLPWYEFTAYFQNPANATKLNVDDIITDSVANQYKVSGYYNPGNLSQDETNFLCQEGWKIKVEFITIDTLPAEDSDYNSTAIAPIEQNWYEFEIYFENTAKAVELRLNDIVTDSTLNQYKIIGFYQPGNTFNNQTNSLCQEGWKVKVEFITADVLPFEDTELYESSVESVTLPGYLPSVAWSAFPYDILPTIPAYHYTCKIAANSAADPGSGELEFGYFFVDYNGKIYEIVEIINPSAKEVRLRDITETGNNPPSTNLGYVYKTTQDAYMLSQAKYYVLDQSARDFANNLEKAAIWEYRGLEISHADGDESNVTHLSLDGLTVEATAGNGWQGGKSLKVTATGSGNVTVPYDNLDSQVDGISNTFTVSVGSYIANTLVVSIGGVINDKDIHYFEEDPATGLIRFVTPPTEEDKPIIAQYQYIP